MPSQPIPGSSGEILHELPSPYLPHAGTGLLHLPRFLAKCRIVRRDGRLPASYAKNYKRGCDRFLCQHLGVDPADIEQAVFAATSDADLEERLRRMLPADVRAPAWNRRYVQMGMTDAGRDFLREALTAMGCPDRAADIRSVPDLMDFDERRIE